MNKTFIMQAINTYLSASEKQKFQAESALLKEALADMSNDNIQLKNTISQSPDKDLPDIVLDELEDFFSSFIRHDTFIGLLRHDLAGIDKMLEAPDEKAERKDKIRKRLSAIRSEIKRAQAIFSNLKTDFFIFSIKKLKGPANP